MWLSLFACVPEPEPEPEECPEACEVTLEVIPPEGPVGTLTVRSDPPGYAFGGELLDPSGAGIAPIAGLSEARFELLPGELAPGQTYTVSLRHACVEGQGALFCRDFELAFEAGAATETDPTGTGEGVTDTFVQELPPEVDVLFVIDNSCSMADEQETLADSFPSFAGFFIESGIDYHLGVTSTDLDGNYNGSGGKLRRVDGQRWIDDQTADPIAVFEQMARMGTSGSGTEKGLGAAFTALEIERDAENRGFLRDDSELHVVVLSDEPDATPASLITRAEFVDWFDGLRPDADDHTFSAIVSPTLGDRYADVAIAIGGIVYDITSPDYATVLEQIGVQASGLRREFVLSEVPDPASLEVSVELLSGATLAMDRDRDYVYDEDRNSVVFLAHPDGGARIVVRYRPAG